MSKHWMDGTPVVLDESGTTLPEDRFFVTEEVDKVYCLTCSEWAVHIDPGDDINTLVRHCFQHLTDCQG